MEPRSAQRKPLAFLSVNSLKLGVLGGEFFELLAWFYCCYV